MSDQEQDLQQAPAVEAAPESAAAPVAPPPAEAPAPAPPPETAPAAGSSAPSSEPEAASAPQPASAQQQAPRGDRPPRGERPPRGDRPPKGERPPRQEGQPAGGPREGGQRDGAREGRGPRPEGQRGEGRGPRPEGGRRDDRRDDRRGAGRPDGPLEIDLEKLVADPLYLDNAAHAVVARMRDLDSGTRSQILRFYNAVRRATRTADADRQHNFVMLRARLAYTIARHSLRSLDPLEKLLLAVTRKNEARGYERFRDLFEAIIAYNE